VLGRGVDIVKGVGHVVLSQTSHAENAELGVFNGRIQ